MTVYFNIRKFHKLPEKIQWAQALFLGAFGLSISFSLLSITDFPFFILIIFLIKPFAHFCLAPLLKLTGFLRYYSPMLLTVKTNSDKLEIHNGNTFDYFSKMKWNQKGRQAREKIMFDYLSGLLKIIEDIETRKLSGTTTLTGISYFFSETTAKKIGFTFAPVKLIHRFLFIFDYINLFIMYSYSKGKIAFPSLFKLKKVKISAKRLLASKTQINELINLLEKRYGKNNVQKSF